MLEQPVELCTGSQQFLRGGKALKGLGERIRTEDARLHEAILSATRINESRLNGGQRTIDHPPAHLAGVASELDDDNRGVRTPCHQPTGWKLELHDLQASVGTFSSTGSEE
jgi:hypothetical protein